MRQGSAKQLVRRKLRRYLGLEDDVVVWSFWVGPPELSLENRAGQLHAVRSVLQTANWDIVDTRPGILEGWFRREVPRLTGHDAVLALEEDERNADAKQHWWLHEATWSNAERNSFVLAGTDPDGNDMSFLGWGRDAAAMLDELKRTLLPG